MYKIKAISHTTFSSAFPQLLNVNVSTQLQLKLVNTDPIGNKLSLLYITTWPCKDINTVAGARSHVPICPPYKNITHVQYVNTSVVRGITCRCFVRFALLYYKKCHSCILNTSVSVWRLCCRLWHRGLASRQLAVPPATAGSSLWQR